MKDTKSLACQIWPIVRFQNGSNEVAIELRVVQFWFEIILVISNRTRAKRSFDFDITRMISDQLALHSVQLAIRMRSHMIIVMLDETCPAAKFLLTNPTGQAFNLG